MTVEDKKHYAFKRVERDDEFRERLIRLGVPKWDMVGVEKDKLDALAWDRKRVQRRIVDDVA